MACHIVEHADSHQQKSAAQKAHDHISNRRFNRPSVLPDHDQAAGGYGIDFHKHIGGEQVVGIYKGQKGTEQQIREDIIKIVLAVFHLAQKLLAPAHQGKEHDNTEKEGHTRFQNSRADFISPGRRKMAHHIGIAGSFTHEVHQQHGGHTAHGSDNNRIQPLGGLCRKNRAHRAGKHG